MLNLIFLLLFVIVRQAADKTSAQVNSGFLSSSLNSSFDGDASLC